MKISNSLKRLTGKSGHRQHHHAVHVSKGGAVLAAGFNHGQIHAEVMALSQLWPNKRAGTTVTSIRITKSGKLALALPCPACMSFLLEARVKTVIYSTNEGTLKKFRIRY